MGNSNHTSDDTTQDQPPVWYRKLLTLATLLARVVRQGGEDGSNVDEGEVYSKITAIITERASEAEQSGPIASGAIDFEAEVTKRKDVVGTGITGLDELLGGGLEAGRLLALLGGPGGGKTSFGNQISVETANSGRPVFYVTSEDPPIDLLSKTLARQGEINFGAVRKYYEDKRGFIDRALATYRKSLAATRLHYLDASMGTSLPIIRAAAASHFEAYKDGGSGILVIDYLQQLARSLSAYREGKQDIRLAVTGITGSLRAMATELDCCVIALASQHREAYKQGGTSEKSALATGKESGDIEYTADVVMALGDDTERPPIDEWTASKVLRIDKNRQGSTGTVLLDWNGAYQRFVEASDDVFASQTDTRSNGHKKGGRK